MKAREFRKLTQKELEKKLKDKRQELIDTAFDIKIGQETNYSVVKKIKFDIARMLTVLNAGTFAESEAAEKEQKDSKNTEKSGKITKSKEKTDKKAKAEKKTK